MSLALRGFYELAYILIVLDEVLCLEISNLARQLKFISEVGDDHPVISHLTASLWLQSITGSTSSARGPINDRKKQLESMGYRLTQERGIWPFLTPRLENVTDKARESSPLLIKQMWKLEISKTRDMMVGTFVTSANEVTIVGFWSEHAKGELRTR